MQNTGRNDRVIFFKCAIKFFMFILSIIFTVVISIQVQGCIDKQNNDKQLNGFIHDVKLGLNKEYVDKKLGDAIFERKNKEYNLVEDVYNTRFAIVRAFYNENQLVGFFITAINDNKQIYLPEKYQDLVSNKQLGEFSFYEILGVPENVFSYFTNGSGHLFYSEEYYFASSGSYNIFYFMYLDYGINSVSLTGDFERYYDDEVTEDICYLGGVTCDRKKSCANTYGICFGEYNKMVFDMMSDYSTVDWDFES